jgi:hypothetical protein
MFSLALLADENNMNIYFRRLAWPMKIRLFSSRLFRQTIFVSRPMKIYIFNSFLVIFDGFWPTKLSCFVVLVLVRLCICFFLLK